MLEIRWFSIVLFVLFLSGGDSCWKSSDCKSSVPSWGFGFGTPWVGLEQDSSASVTKESDIQVHLPINTSVPPEIFV